MIDKNKIPYQFLKNWESYECCGRRVIDVKLFDSPIFRKSIPRQYGVIIKFQNEIQISLDPLLSEADAKWTLRQKFMEKLNERNEKFAGQIKKENEFNSWDDIIGQPVTTNLKESLEKGLTASIKQLMEDQILNSPMTKIAINIRLNEEDSITINPFEEDKNVEEENIPNEIQRFADILDDD